MRLFVALEPPPDARAELEAAVAPLRSEWPRLRWAGQDRWHVTLAFLGEVHEEALEELATRLGRAAARKQALRAHIGRGGAFPSARRARVLCAHIEGAAQALAEVGALAASVAAAARRAGAPPGDEDRRYRPHLTLARCREPTDLSELVATLAGFAGSAWTAQYIHLIRSYLGPQPRYETIGSWALGGRQTLTSRTSAAPGTSRTDLAPGPT
jgi:2'-5' RNA ligase